MTNKRNLHAEGKKFCEVPQTFRQMLGEIPQAQQDASTLREYEKQVVAIF